MTMKRNDKEAMCKRNIEILIGAEKIYSPSPRRLAEFGRYAPAEWAAKFIMGYTRRQQSTGYQVKTRESVTTDRIRARRRVRRVARVA